jgi:hypothetical protein
VLRNELAPLNVSPDQLHSLTKCVLREIRKLISPTLVSLVL